MTLLEVAKSGTFANAFALIAKQYGGLSVEGNGAFNPELVETTGDVDSADFVRRLQAPHGRVVYSADDTTGSVKLRFDTAIVECHLEWMVDNAHSCIRYLLPQHYLAAQITSLSKHPTKIGNIVLHNLIKENEAKLITYASEKNDARDISRFVLNHLHEQ